MRKMELLGGKRWLQRRWFQRFPPVHRLIWIVWGVCAMISVWSIITAFDLPAGSWAVGRYWQAIGDVVSHFLFVLILILATLIISRQPANLIGWLLLVPCLIAFAVGNILRYLAGFQAAPPPASLPILLLVWICAWAWVAFIIPLLLIPLFFPTGRLLTPRWRAVVYLAVGLCLFMLVWSAGEPVFYPTLVSTLVSWELRNPIGFLPGALIPYGLAFIVIMGSLLTAASLASIAARYRNASAEERAQIKWLLFGCSIFGLIYIPFLFLNLLNLQPLLDLFNLLFILGLACLPISITIAILRYRLFEIDLLINRALVYGTLTALVIGLNVLVVGYLGTVLRTGEPVWFSIVATGLAVVLVQPLRDSLQRGVNRLMYGRRDEPVAVLSQLGTRLESILLPDEILPGLVDTVAQALKLPYAAVNSSSRLNGAARPDLARRFR